jgi:hypothetical protein
MPVLTRSNTQVLAKSVSGAHVLAKSVSGAHVLAKSVSGAHVLAKSVSGAQVKPIALSQKKLPLRTTRTRFSQEAMKELYDIESDKDASPDYTSEDEEVQHMPPKYEVDIDFDEASREWRANKRRVGECWVYKKIAKSVAKPKETVASRTRSKVSK